MVRGGPAIQKVETAVYRIPTDAPESDSTLTWNSTTMVLVEVTAADMTGLGYTYASAAAATVADEQLAPVVCERCAFDIPGIWHSMRRAVRNIGYPGVAACAISAVDVALWDLKARLLGLSLVDLLGMVRDQVPVYGSGGFTSYGEDRLGEQLANWAGDGVRAVKMKVGREPQTDPARVRTARAAIGSDVTLMVDANGAFTTRQALTLAYQLAESAVSWFEEPVSSDDLDGLRFIRDHAPAGVEIAAGEYGYDVYYLRRMLDSGAVDVLQADATRCGGFSGVLQAAALCTAAQMPLSTHTAPALHMHVACAAEPIRDVEYFHDHVRIESMLLDGFAGLQAGCLRPDRNASGHGLTLRRSDAESYRVA